MKNLKGLSIRGETFVIKLHKRHSGVIAPEVISFTTMLNCKYLDLRYVLHESKNYCYDYNYFPNKLALSSKTLQNNPNFLFENNLFRSIFVSYDL